MSYCCVTYTWDPSKDDNISRCCEVCMCPPGLRSVKGVRLGVTFCQKPVRPPGGSGCRGRSVSHVALVLLCHFQEVSIKVLILLTEWEAKVILWISILHVASNLKSAGDTEGHFEQLRNVYREHPHSVCILHWHTLRSEWFWTPRRKSRGSWTLTLVLRWYFWHLASLFYPNKTIIRV